MQFINYENRKWRKFERAFRKAEDTGKKVHVFGVFAEEPKGFRKLYVRFGGGNEWWKSEWGGLEKGFNPIRYYRDYTVDGAFPTSEFFVGDVEDLRNSTCPRVHNPLDEEGVKRVMDLLLTPKACELN